MERQVDIYIGDTQKGQMNGKNECELLTGKGWADDLKQTILSYKQNRFTNFVTVWLFNESYIKSMYQIHVRNFKMQ